MWLMPKTLHTPVSPVNLTKIQLNDKIYKIKVRVYVETSVVES